MWGLHVGENEYDLVNNDNYYRNYSNSILQTQSGKMSAITDTTDGPIEVIQVLFALHPGFGAQELCGPLEVLSKALHKLNDPSEF